MTVEVSNGTAESLSYSNGGGVKAQNPNGGAKKSRESERRRRRRKQKKNKGSAGGGGESDASVADGDESAKENSDPQQVFFVYVFLVLDVVPDRTYVVIRMESEIEVISICGGIFRSTRPPVDAMRVLLCVYGER